RAPATRYANHSLGGRAGDVVGTTGASPARLAQFNAIEDSLPIVEAASVALVLIIVGIAFRSLGAPLVTLSAALISYLIAIRGLPWVGDRLGVSVPVDGESSLSVLLLG